MKIKRFLAKNMREAIRLVREEQGPDAVILSNRRVGKEIEVVAAVDYDAALMQQALRHERAQAATPPAPPPPVEVPVMVAPQAAMPVPPPATPARTTPPSAPVIVKTPDLEHLRAEMGGMRRLIEQQLSGLIWNDMKQRSPESVAALSLLTDLGIDMALARSIAGDLPPPGGTERARFLPLGLLSRRIPVHGGDPVLNGGVIALIGPTGVGKTTTLAKLAARYAEHHGTRDIAVITTDHYRIGAQEQLFTYGRLLGVPVYTASNATELSQALSRLSDRKLVLIDTAGMSPRDRNLAAQFATLQGVSTRIQTYLVMAANCQAGDLDEVVRKFGRVPLAGAVLTKIDEASRIGGALSVLIRHKLKLAYTTDGQRVPEDLQLARAERVVLRAMQLARQSPAQIEDMTLAMNFGGGAHAQA
ncbi:MAG: flagellar biosynthesis protein FlhF [Nevskiaceae bacterium]|nr:MAG: flagellar biosynthesis protein FlhF [Nevskiaceae bacterium]